MRELKNLSVRRILEPEQAVRDKMDRDSLTELADSLKKLGQLQPILVRKENEFFRIEAGHRRFLAAQMLGWDKIDAIILDTTNEDNLHIERAHENLIRVDLNPIEESNIVYTLVYEDGRGVEKAAALLCRSTNWIDSRLDIYKMPEDVKAAISCRDINVAVAKELCRVRNHETRERYLKSAIEYGASASVVKRWISDSSVGQYLENQESQQAATGEFNTVGLSQVMMLCRICNISHMIDVLRHIWICPDCMGSMRELSTETRKAIAELDAAPKTA